MNDWAEINITDGTDQDARNAAALQPGYFDVDEHGFEALLAMAAEFAAKVNFYNLRNEVDGSWAELFSADEAVIMAMIMSTDLKRIEAEFRRRYGAGPEVLAAHVFQYAKQLNFWFIKLQAVEQASAQSLAGKIAAVIENKLISELHSLGQLLTRLQQSGLGIDFAPFDPLWGVQREGNHYRFPRAQPPATDMHEIRRQLRGVFYAFFNAISYLKSITPLHLQQSLGSQLHDPASGLFMAFLKLFERAQRKLNGFTQRHLDFYYRDVLGVAPRGAQADGVHLCFEAEAGARAVHIAKGSAFSAGKDEMLQEVIYRSDDHLLLTDAKVVSLRTLHLQRDELLSPEHELGYVSRLKSNSLELADADSSELRAWPLFGAEKRGVTRGTSADAQIGFAIASPLLLLKEGQRQVILDVELQDMVNADSALMVALLCKAGSEQEFVQLFGRLFSRHLFSSGALLDNKARKEIIASAASLLGDIALAEVKSLLIQARKDLFYKLLHKMFSISLTGDAGLFEVHNYLVTPLPATAQARLGFRLTFTLGAESGALVPYDTQLHGAGFDATLPLLICRLNPQSHFCAYSIFHDLLLQRLTLEVDVRGVKSLKAYNQHGELDPSKPFLPFGPLPGINAFFIFGAHEIALKNVTNLNVVLEWAELPSQRGGFEQHYQGYDTVYGNDSFKIDFSVLADSAWQPREEGERQRQSLFSTQAESSAIDSQHGLSVPVLKYAKPMAAHMTLDTFGYGINAREGFFRLGLVEPAAAFGHREYPALLTKVLSANAKRKTPLPLPNPPYTPTLNRISLDYTARAMIDIAQLRARPDAVCESVYHLHPFGIEKLGRAGQEKPCFLLPQYGYEGNLFIGIEASRLAGPLTLFFHLAEDMAREVAAQQQAINWFYLAGDNWKALPEARLLSDTTDGFLTSGIVTLDIPADIDRDNSIMPSAVFWLRVSTRRELESFCSLYAVRCHAVKLTRQADSDAALQRTVVGANKWQPLSSITGVGRIHQLGRMLTGAPPETRAQLITRVSESLHHKNRASTPWDYERLILQQFPGVYKVKCFPNMASSGPYPRPGHVLIVVVPYLHKEERQGCPRAMMNSIELSRIRSFVQSLASPFAEIEVRNPAYEQVQVRCTVKFNSAAGAGDYINRLDQAIADYICPWQKTGYQARFGWRIRQKDIEAHIRSQAYVDYVTNFSMLHITQDGKGDYRMYDSAMDESSREALIRPRYPWSLAIPARHQFIETIQTASPIVAAVTGVDELEVGGTFIISGNSEYGKEE